MKLLLVLFFHQFRFLFYSVYFNIAAEIWFVSITTRDLSKITSLTSVVFVSDLKGHKSYRYMNMYEIY